MKKLTIISTILCLWSAQAMAANFDGAYIGLQGGYESTRAKLSDTGLGAFAGAAFSDDVALTGFNGGAFAGYGKRFDSLYLGAELEGDFSNAESKSDATIPGVGVLEIHLRHKYDYGASVRAGFFPVKDTLLYGKAGVVRGRFEDRSVSSEDTLTGARFGVGAETALAPNFTARADWTYTNYQTAHYADANQTGSADPSSSIFRVGLAYNF